MVHGGVLPGPARRCESSGSTGWSRWRRPTRHFELAPDYSVDEIITGTRLFEAERAETLVVRYSARIAGWIAEREGKCVAPDGSLTLEHPLADEHWAMRHVLQYGPEAEVLAPKSVRQQLAARLRQLEEAFQ